MIQLLRKLIYLNIALITVFVISCSAPVHKTPVVHFVEKERTISKSFDTVWQSAVEWFATHNTPIKNIDKNSGLLSTEYSLSLKEAAKFMDCGMGESNFKGKVELVKPTGNFNLLVKKADESLTKVTVNVFFSCVVNKYRYESLLSTEYVLESSERTDCTSTGNLEKEILDYLAK